MIKKSKRKEVGLVKRNYGIDLLRCFSMFLVAVLHILGHGGVLDAGSGVNYAVSWLLETAAYCAVNCYALISGFVGIRAKYKYSSIIMLWLQVVFYTLLITLAFYIASPEQIGLLDFRKALFPLSNNTYWYFTAYFGLFILMPILNAGINALSEKQAVLTAILLFSVFSLFKTISSINADPNIFNLNSGYAVLWLCLLYIIGGCIGKYDMMKRFKTVYFIVGYIAVTAFALGFKLVAERKNFTVPSNIFINYLSPTVVLAAICLLGFFSNLKINGVAEKIIGFFAPASFGVYLIHEHPLIRETLMRGRFAFLADKNTVVLALSVIGLAAAVFIVCAVIDRIRIAVFELVGIKKLVCKIDK